MTNIFQVLHSSILGLEQQCEVLDRMGMDKQSIMVIHGGGVYGNKAEALERLEKNILSLHKNVRERLVLENDEMAYNLEDLLPISQKLKIPVVVDFHHDAIYRSSMPVEDYLPAVFQVRKNSQMVSYPATKVKDAFGHAVYNGLCLAFQGLLG